MLSMDLPLIAACKIGININDNKHTQSHTYLNPSNIWSWNSRQKKLTYYVKNKFLVK